MILHKFIVFEGIDGAGTSTQLEKLKQRPETSDFLFTAEPTGGEIGKFLRRMLKGDIAIEQETAAYLFAADRYEHVNGKLRCEGQQLISGIEEACKEGKFVVSDRYLFSSLAYQGISCHENLPYILNSPFPLPHILFYFDIEPAISLKRIKERETKEIYEEENFLKKVSQGYKSTIERLSQQEKEMKVVMLDALKSREELANIIWEEISLLRK